MLPFLISLSSLLAAIYLANGEFCIHNWQIINNTLHGDDVILLVDNINPLHNTGEPLVVGKEGYCDTTKSC